MPELADNEYKLLAKRAISNWLPLLVDTPAQALYVDGFRRGDGNVGPEMDSPSGSTGRARASTPVSSRSTVAL